MQDKKISYWQLWQVDEQGSERQAESLHILKDLIKKAAHFLHVKVSIPLRLVKKQSYLSALHELGGQCGLGAMGVGDKANINLHLPMLARRKANSEVVLLLPKWPRKFFIVQSSTNTIQTLCDKQILSLFDDFIQFYPIEPRRKNFSWSIFASKIASLFPKRHQVGLGLGMILFLFGALGFISILLSDFGNNNKIAFSGAALICFAAVLYFANLAQGRLAKNLPIAHVWTLNFIYHTIFHLKAQELPKLHIDNIKTLIAKTSKDIKIYFRETYLLVASFLSVFVVLLIVLYINLFLFFILACFVVFIVLSALFLSKNMSYDADQIATKKTELNELLDGFCASFDALIGLNAYTPALEKIAQANHRLKKHEKRILYASFLMKIGRFAGPLISVWFMVIGIIYLDHQDLEVWQVLFLVFVALIFGSAVAFLLEGISTVPLAALSKKNIQKFEAISLVKKESRVKIINMKGGIEVQNLSFSYDDDSALVLKNINMTILPEKFYLIHGASGAGKSTLLQILMTQFLPKNGQIIFDGQDMLSLDLLDLRQNFGVVRQDSFLMAGSILDNILAGRDLPNRNIKDLMLNHEVFDVLLDLPMGLQTYVYWHAKNLSRLEQILILLARALVHKPKILFLDEALMGITETEQKRLGKLLHAVAATKILVSHESKNLYNADEVFSL